VAGAGLQQRFVCYGTEGFFFCRVMAAKKCGAWGRVRSRRRSALLGAVASLPPDQTDHQVVASNAVC
jgi:hypothetical protein